MGKPDIKVSIPKFEQIKQNPLYTPKSKPQNTKPIPLVSWFNFYSSMKESVPKEEVEDLYEKISPIWDEADKEDLYGKLFSENEDFDRILNENEQKTILQILKEKQPKLFEIANNFIQKLWAKSDVARLTNNLSVQENNWASQQLISYILQELDNENFMAVSKESNALSLLYSLYEDAKDMAETEIDTFNPDYCFKEGEERTEEKMKYYQERFQKEVLEPILKKRENGKKDMELIEEKSVSCANYLIQLARKEKVHSSDYENELLKAIENNDIKNIAIYTQRLSDRIFMKKDREDKTVNASKRAIELKEANGQIDSTFVQGYTGDCWFLSALKSMCSDPKVLYRINNMITLNKEKDVIKSITVNIQGKDYTFDYENIKGANEYSTGDLDVRALEMAVNQYMHDNNLGEGDITLGWYEKDAYKFLFGEDNVDVTDYITKDKDGDDIFDPKGYLKALKQQSKDTVMSSLSIGRDKKWNYETEEYEKKDMYAEDKDGNKVELKFPHTYAYTRIDDENFYFTDPHAPLKELKMPLEKFGKIFDTANTVKIKDDNKDQANL